MAVATFMGVNFTGLSEVLLILLQLICCVNSYYVNVVLLGPLPFAFILVLTLLYSRCLLAFQLVNSTHLDCGKSSKNSQYCRRCGTYISSRDHHCIFLGRCVEKSNYPYFVSYLLYAYLLAAHTLLTVLGHYDLLLEYANIQMRDYLPLLGALVSSAYFLIFTAALLSSSFRSIFLGIYTVEEVKKVKEARYSSSQIRKMWFSRAGRAIIISDFKTNWKRMVGEEVSWKQILLVY